MLNKFEYLLLYSTVIFDTINIILSISAFYLGIKNKFPHFNIKVLIISWFFGIFFQHFGQLIFMATVLKGEKLALSNNLSLDLIGRILTFFGIFSNRVILLLIGFERTVATLQLNFYEKRQRSGFTIVLVIVWFLVTILLDYIYFLTKYLAFAYVTICLIIDIPAITTSISIRLWNQHLNKSRQNSNFSLTQRYQLTENLRLLKAQVPLVFTAHLLSMFSIILMFCMNFNIHSIFTKYHSLIFHAINAFFSTIYILMALIVFKKPFKFFVPKRFFGRFFSIQAQQIHRISDQITNTTMENNNRHFQMLQQSWN